MMLKRFGQNARIFEILCELLGPGHSRGWVRRKAAGAGNRSVRTGKLRIWYGLVNHLDEATPIGEVGRISRSGNMSRCFIDSRIQHLARARVKLTHVWLIPDGKTIKIRPVSAPDISSNLRIIRCEVRVRANGQIFQAHRVDDFDTSCLGKLEKIVDILERRSLRDTVLRLSRTIHGSAADPNIFDPDVPEQSNELLVLWGKEVARDSIGVRQDAFRFKTKPGKIGGNCKFAGCFVDGQLDRRLCVGSAYRKKAEKKQGWYSCRQNNLL